MKNSNLTKLLERIERLEEVVFGSGEIKSKTRDKVVTKSKDIDFLLNERAFVNRYATDKSGPKKFTLLLAFLVKGKNDKNMELSEVKKHWNKMSAKNLLGKFNMFYPNEAKTRGWVDSKKHGSYCLTNEWKKVL
jgi:hypothetical protein